MHKTSGKELYFYLFYFNLILFYLRFCFVFLHCAISFFPLPLLTFSSFNSFLYCYFFLLISLHFSKLPNALFVQNLRFVNGGSFAIQIFPTGKRFSTVSLRNVLITIKILSLTFAGKRVHKTITAGLNIWDLLFNR